MRTMLQTQYPAIENFIRDTTGINPDATPGILSRTVERFLAENKYIDADDLLMELKSSKKSFDSFLQQILVPETWFFRYPDSYQFLKRWARQQIISKKQIRILSVPCSTGEEAFSIAMALLDSGISTQQVTIDAADISAEALKKAEEGIYSNNSFRGTELDFRTRYFTKKDNSYLIAPQVRKLVRFWVWNVHDRPPAGLRRIYDVIFCRNLFIYFHQTAQKEMKTILNDLLDSKGLLFTGHAEAGTLVAPSFKSIPPVRAFVHCKK
jgi:chemotaxis protein methyltransferase WspC